MGYKFAAREQLRFGTLLGCRIKEVSLTRSEKHRSSTRLVDASCMTPRAAFSLLLEATSPASEMSIQQPIRISNPTCGHFVALSSRKTRRTSDTNGSVPTLAKTAAKRWKLSDALPKGDTSAPASPAFFPWRMDLEHSTPSFAGHKKAPALSLCAWLELAWTLQKEYLGRLVNHASPSFLGIFVFSRNVFEEGPA
jgi:hypothetical protein